MGTGEQRTHIFKPKVNALPRKRMKYARSIANKNQVVCGCEIVYYALA